MSDSLLRNVLSFVAGLAVAVITFAAGYQLLFPALCAVDGMLWAAWAQVIVIAVTAAFAGIIAFGQLKTLQQTQALSIKTTKVQNAMVLISQIYKKIAIGRDVKISPMEATGEIHEVRHAPGAMERFRAAYGRIVFREVARGAEPDAERVSYEIAVVNNYFGGMHVLLQTDTFDNDVILDRSSRLCLDTYNEVVELHARPPREEFYQMAKASYSYMKARGQNPVAPPDPYSVKYIRPENV